MFQTITSINNVLLGTEIVLILVCIYLLATHRKSWKSWQFFACGTFIAVTWSWRLLFGIISSRYALMLLPASCLALVYLLYNLPQITAWGVRKKPEIFHFFQKNGLGIARCIIVIIAIGFFCKAVRCNPYQYDILQTMIDLDNRVKNDKTALICNYYDTRIMHYVKDLPKNNFMYVTEPMSETEITKNLASLPEADTIFFIGKIAKDTENSPKFREFLKKSKISRLKETWINKKKKHKFVLYQYSRRSKN